MKKLCGRTEQTSLPSPSLSLKFPSLLHPLSCPILPRRRADADRFVGNKTTTAGAVKQKRALAFSNTHIHRKRALAQIIMSSGRVNIWPLTASSAPLGRRRKRARFTAHCLPNTSPVISRVSFSAFALLKSFLRLSGTGVGYLIPAGVELSFRCREK